LGILWVGADCVIAQGWYAEEGMVDHIVPVVTMPGVSGISVVSTGASYSSPFIQVADNTNGGEVTALKGPVLTVVYQQPTPGAYYRT
jgi:hypothetical protein